MTTKHTLHIALRSDQTIRVGTNNLQLVVYNNSPVMNYKQVVIRLHTPLGVRLIPSKVEIAPLPANSNNITELTLTTKQPGRHQIRIQANTFPKPKEEEFPYMIQQVEVFPELETTSDSGQNFILEDITYFQSKGPDNESDVYSSYLIGLNRLKRHIEYSHPQYSDFLAYEQQLKENIRATQRFGDTENLRARRSEVVEYLNKLTLSTLNTTFNDLCE